MTQEHPITPPPELVEQWRAAASNVPVSLSTDPGGRRDYIAFIATQAARWGADQELEACVNYVDNTISGNKARALRAARRPKPPSLKETLLARVARIPGEDADAAYLRHWVDNESQRLVDLLHEVFKSLPD